MLISKHDRRGSPPDKSEGLGRFTACTAHEVTMGIYLEYILYGPDSLILLVHSWPFSCPPPSVLVRERRGSLTRMRLRRLLLTILVSSKSLIAVALDDLDCGARLTIPSDLSQYL